MQPSEAVLVLPHPKRLLASFHHLCDFGANRRHVNRAFKLYPATRLVSRRTVDNEVDDGRSTSLYSAKRAVPIDAIGAADRDNVEEMAAVKAGCLAGQLGAFSATRFTPPPDWLQPEDGGSPG